jgi:hypothetical protein
MTWLQVRQSLRDCRRFAPGLLKPLLLRPGDRRLAARPGGP